MDLILSLKKLAFYGTLKFCTITGLHKNDLIFSWQLMTSNLKRYINPLSGSGNVMKLAWLGLGSHDMDTGSVHLHSVWGTRLNKHSLTVEVHIHIQASRWDQHWWTLTSEDTTNGDDIWGRFLELTALPRQRTSPACIFSCVTAHFPRTRATSMFNLTSRGDESGWNGTCIHLEQSRFGQCSQTKNTFKLVTGEPHCKFFFFFL